MKILGRIFILGYRISRGGNVLSGSEAPWMAALIGTYKTWGEKEKFICGGCLLSVRHMLIAAHCYSEKYDRKKFDKVKVGVGMTDRNHGERMDVIRAERHPDHEELYANVEDIHGKIKGPHILQSNALGSDDNSYAQ